MKRIAPALIVLLAASPAPAQDNGIIRPGVSLRSGGPGDATAFSARATGTPVSRPFADWLADTPNIKAFGAPSNGDWTTVFQAAESSNAKQVFLPAGRYPVTLNHYQAINKTYVGPGQIVVNANSSGAGGTAEAPFRSFITSTLPDLPTDKLTAFDGDWSKSLPNGVAYSFIGAGATGTAGTVYKNFPQLSQTFRIYDYTAGYNTDPADHDKGRSGAFADVLRLSHGGQGDVVGQTFNAEVYSNRSGATHWLANPAVVARNGNFTATGSGTGAYLNESEFVYKDNGLSVAVIDRVRRYDRSNNNTALYQVWVHDRPQVVGTLPIDCFYCPSGAARRGYDMTAANMGTEGAAVVLAPGQKVYLAGTSVGDPLLGTKFGATDLGGAWVVYDTATKTIRINPGSGNSVAIDNLPTASTGLSSGSIWRDAANSNVLKAVP